MFVLNKVFFFFFPFSSSSSSSSSVRLLFKILEKYPFRSKRGHVWRMTTDIPAKAAISWFPTDHNRNRGRPRIDWIQIIKQDLNRRGLNWEDLSEVTANRVHWKQLTALCAVGAGGSKV